MSEQREFVYQKKLPGQKYILKNRRQEMVQGYGVKVHHPGMYATFRGPIPEFDVEPEADQILLWELQTGKAYEADKDKRRKQIIKEICSKIESHPDFTAGKIWKKKTSQEKIEEVGVFVCEVCKDVKKTVDLLIEHKKTHKEPNKPQVEGIAHV